nr:MAG TPA: hypothetical protein [Caudoviricetes sp.]
MLKHPFRELMSKSAVRVCGQNVAKVWPNRDKNSRTRRLRGKTWSQQSGLNR